MSAVAVVENVVETLLGSVLESSPGGRDTSPASSALDRELERVRVERRPLDGDRLPVARAKEVEVLNGLVATQLGDFRRHADLGLIVHDEGCAIAGRASGLVSSSKMALRSSAFLDDCLREALLPLSSGLLLEEPTPSAFLKLENLPFFCSTAGGAGSGAGAAVVA